MFFSYLEISPLVFTRFLKIKKTKKTMIFENNFFKFSKSLTYPVKMIVFLKNGFGKTNKNSIILRIKRWRTLILKNLTKSFQ